MMIQDPQASSAALLYTARGMAATLGVSPTTLRRWVVSDTLPPAVRRVPAGKRWRYYFAAPPLSEGGVPPWHRWRFPGDQAAQAGGSIVAVRHARDEGLSPSPHGFVPRTTADRPEHARPDIDLPEVPLEALEAYEEATYQAAVLEEGGNGGLLSGAHRLASGEVDLGDDTEPEPIKGIQWSTVRRAHGGTALPAVHVGTWGSKERVVHGPRQLHGAPLEHLRDNMKVTTHPTGQRPRDYNRHPSFAVAPSLPSALSRHQSREALVDAFRQQDGAPLENALPRPSYRPPTAAPTEHVKESAGRVLDTTPAAPRSVSGYTAPVYTSEDVPTDRPRRNVPLRGES